MQFRDNGVIGKRISFEEQFNRKLQKKKDIATSCQKAATRAEIRASEFLRRAEHLKTLLDNDTSIPPVLNRRIFNERIRRATEQGDNATAIAERYKQKAISYQKTVTESLAKLLDPAYLKSRISISKLLIRQFKLRMEEQLPSMVPSPDIDTSTWMMISNRVKTEREGLAFYSDKLKQVRPAYFPKTKEKSIERYMELLVGRLLIPDPHHIIHLTNKEVEAGTVITVFPEEKKLLLRFQNRSYSEFEIDALRMLRPYTVILKAIMESKDKLDVNDKKMGHLIYRMIREKKDAQALKLSVNNTALIDLCTINCLDFLKQKQLRQNQRAIRPKM